MSKVTYLLGAGASAGQKDLSGQRISGVPTISEFAYEVDKCRIWLTQQFPEIANLFVDDLLWLKDICTQYPTVDTYARQLSVTRQLGDFKRLKAVLTCFLTIIQLQYQHDIRYDGWIASVINADGSFPQNVNMLSWNYDAQFELAYKGYEIDLSLKSMWSVLNVMNKSFLFEPRDNDKFSIVKLNGTAFFHNDDGINAKTLNDIIVYQENLDSVIEQLKKLKEISSSENYINELSYVWETRNFHEKFKEGLILKIKDTESLVVIGYSFPYVNRSMDKLIFQSMKNLRTVYIQDTEPEKIMELVAARLSNREGIKIIPITNTNQFYIPVEMDE